MKCRVSIFAKSCIVLLVFLASGAGWASEINRTFENVKVLHIKTVSGDCIIKKGTNNKVTVQVSSTYDEDEFEAEITQRGSTLKLRERFTKNRKRSWSSRGKSKWILTVPDNMEISFSTASGDFELSDLKDIELDAGTASGSVTVNNLTGQIDIGTASGDVRAAEFSGKIKIGTASGDIRFREGAGTIRAGTASGDFSGKNLKGNLRFSAASGSVDVRGAEGKVKISTASGDVSVSDAVISERSSFSAASGNVSVGMITTPKEDLTLTAASGDVELAFNGNQITGTIEATARAGRNRIQAPFSFDENEKYFEHGREYVKKIAKKGNGPLIELHSASGEVVIEK